MALGLQRQAQAAVAHREMLAGRGHDNPAGRGRDQLALLGVGDAPRRLAVQPVGEGGAERLGDMQHEQDRQGEAVGQAVQHIEDGAGAPRGGADRRHRTFLRLARRGGHARRGRCGGRLRNRGQPAAGMGDDTDARDQLQRDQVIPGPDLVAAAAGEFFDDVHGTRGQRVIGAEQLTAVDRGGDHQDRGGEMRHDIFGGGQSRHQRHHHVHGQHVGLVTAHQFDGFLAVGGLADQLQLGVGQDDLHQALAHRQ